MAQTRLNSLVVYVCVSIEFTTYDIFTICLWHESFFSIFFLVVYLETFCSLCQILLFYRRMIRKHSLFANTQFMGVCYHPSGVQIVTTGTDRKIGYWEVYDGSLIREIEGSGVSALNAIDITRNGEHMVTGGNDHYVKVNLCPMHIND